MWRRHPWLLSSSIKLICSCSYVTRILLCFSLRQWRSKRKAIVANTTFVLHHWSIRVVSRCIHWKSKSSLDWTSYWSLSLRVYPQLQQACPDFILSKRKWANSVRRILSKHSGILSRPLVPKVNHSSDGLNDDGWKLLVKVPHLLEPDESSFRLWEKSTQRSKASQLRVSSDFRTVIQEKKHQSW